MTNELVILLVVAVILVVSGVCYAIGNTLTKGKDAGTLDNLPVWKSGSVPFTLILDAALQGIRLRRACTEAVAFWQRQVPGLWANFGDVGSGATVPIMPARKMANWDKVVSHGAVGYTRLTVHDGHTWSAAVYLDAYRLDDLTDLQLMRAIAHELGHVFGLAHDGNRLSVMYPATLNEPPTVTAKDRALLLGLYT